MRRIDAVTVTFRLKSRAPPVMPLSTMRVRDDEIDVHQYGLPRLLSRAAQGALVKDS